MNTFEIAHEAMKRGQIPCLVGPPQRGKTHGIKLLAEANNYRLHITNPYFNPEEWSGLPHIRNGAVQWTKPIDIPEEMLEEGGRPWVWFIDELDKASDDNMHVFLPLFAEDRVRSHKFPSDRIMKVCAMNERSGMVEALMARLLFLQYPDPSDSADILARGDFKNVKSLAEELYGGSPNIRFPERPEAPASLHKLVKWFDLPQFWENETVRTRVVRGLFPEKQVPRVLGFLLERPTTSIEDAVRWIQKAGPQEVVDRFLRITVDLVPPAGDQKGETAKQLTDALFDRTQNDPTGEWTKVCEAFSTTREIAENGFAKEDGWVEATKVWKQKVGHDLAKGTTAPTAKTTKKKS